MNVMNTAIRWRLLRLYKYISATILHSIVVSLYPNLIAKPIYMSLTSRTVKKTLTIENSSINRTKEEVLGLVLSTVNILKQMNKCNIKKV